MLLYLQQTRAGETVVLEDGKDMYFIADLMEILADSSDELSIRDVSHPDYSRKFRQETIPDMHENYTTYWLRFHIHNKRSSENLSWYFESWGFDLDFIELYVPDGYGGFYKSSAGYGQSFNTRNIHHKNPVFFLNLKNGEYKTYYIKLKKGYPRHLTFIVRHHEALIKHVVYEYWYLGMFYGIFFLVILLNLYLFVSLKDSLHVYYIFLALSEVLYCFGRDGLAFQFIWPDVPALNTFTFYIYTQFFFVISTLCYSIKFLNLKRNNRFLYTISIAAIIFNSGLFLYSHFYSYDPFILFSIDAAIMIIPLISGITLLKQGKTFSIYYVIAFTFLFSSFIIAFLEEKNYMPDFILNWYMINIGMLLEAIFLAAANLDQIRILRKKNERSSLLLISELREKQKLKDKLNEELEEKVIERTEQINSMMLRLEEKNRELNQMNKDLEFMSQEVKRMNDILSLDNIKLKTDLAEISRSRVLLKDVKFNEFKNAFPDDESCLKFLSDLKWSNGFRCRKCAYNKAITSENYGMRCRNCKYNESPTAGTLFHKLKFPISKAFYLMYLVQVKGTNVTVDELSEMVSLRRETCWSFRNKILQVQKEQTEKTTQDSGWISLVFAGEGGKG